MSGGLKAAATFGVGYLVGRLGAFDKMLLKPMLEGTATLRTKITYNLSKIVLAHLIPSIGRTTFTGVSLIIGETLAKMLIFSTLGDGARWVIDKFFGT